MRGKKTNLSYSYNRKKKKNIVLNPLRIFIISDTHIKASVENNPDATGALRDSDGRYYYTSPDKLRGFVDDVNSAKPDLVLHLGDVAEDPAQADFDVFNGIWGGIDPTIPKHVTIGNHDISYEDNGFNENVPVWLGVSNNPVIAGSHFNYSFKVENETQSLKVIMLDTNRNTDGSINRTSNAVLSTAVRQWIENEIEGSTEDSILIISHHSPYVTHVDGNYSFVTSHAQYYFNMVANKLNSRVGNIMTVSGHYHSLDGKEYRHANDRGIGLLTPTAVLYESANYYDIEWKPDVLLKKELVPLTYPYNP